MTVRRACPPAPRPLEQYTAAFDDLFISVAQRRGFRECLTGAVQRLQCFMSESPWDAEKINDWRIELLTADPATRPHEQGVLVADDTAHRPTMWKPPRSRCRSLPTEPRYWRGHVRHRVAVLAVSGCTTRCTWHRTPRPGGCPPARPTRSSPPSRRVVAVPTVGHQRRERYPRRAGLLRQPHRQRRSSRT